MKLAFYKAFQDRATYLDKTIAVATFGPYSHVEIVFENGTSFSVSARDGGSRFKRIKYHEESWDLYDLGIPPSQETMIKEAIVRNFLNKQYDYIGAVFSALPVCIQKDKKLFCSEAVVNLLKHLPQYGRFRDGCRYSPNDLSRVLKKCRYNFKKIKI